jgi:signal transduction histidine kinase/DNA-binding response OmpR family regulator
MAKKIKKIITRLIFSNETPMTARIFNAVMIFGLAAGLAGFLTTVLAAPEPISILSILALLVGVLLLFLGVNKTQNYRLGGLLVTFLICGVAFPVIFFFNGGIHSGMVVYFVLGVVVIATLLEGKRFYMMLAFYIAVCIACFFIQYAGLLPVTPIESEFMVYVDIAVSFFIASLSVCLVVKFQNQMYIKARQEAETASKVKSDFLANMSHEIRTPINAITGMTSIGKSATDLERKNYAFEKIEVASNHLLGVINDILDMSKIEAGKLGLSYTAFNFELMLKKIVNLNTFRIAEKHQEFTVHIDKDIPQCLIGDDLRLSQVITNLLSNAVKFTPERGSIKLNACLLEREKSAYTIQIAVSDTGIGLSSEQQGKLFSSFQQAESSTSRKFGGTGLGLAISKRIVELMGGEIWIESELGKGSIFAFTVKATPAEKDEKQVIAASWKDLRLLIVDDDEDILQYFKANVELSCACCDIAASGEDALAFIEKNGGYDIHFVDWKMPGMDGIELSRRIKATSTGNSIVIMISGMDLDAIADEAKIAGVDKFLPKPLFLPSITDIINECLEVGQLISAEEISSNEVDNFGDYHLLLAEDMDINREIAIALLEPTRIGIDSVTNGAEALRMFSEAPDRYDMIFMDVQMPEMDGYEATRRIRAIGTPRARGIPIVAMTANVFREDVERCIEAGMDDHLGKPLNLDEMLDKLRRYLPQLEQINL